MGNRFYFRIPEFTDKGNFNGFQYVELGESIECGLCGSIGSPQQYLGRKDKKGKRVFVGDILKIFDGSFVEIKWIDELLRYDIELNDEIYKNHSSKISNVFGGLCWILNECWFEIAGNIHENPELLKLIEGSKRCKH